MYKDKPRRNGRFARCLFFIFSFVLGYFTKHIIHYIFEDINIPKTNLRRTRNDKDVHRHENISNCGVCKCAPNAWAKKGLPPLLIPPKIMDDEPIQPQINLCPAGHWSNNDWIMESRCRVNSLNKLERKWVIMAGDSNTRKNYYEIVDMLGLKGGSSSENAWTGAERWSEEYGFRMSFRFVPYNELRDDGYTTGTLLLHTPQYAYKYAQTTPFEYKLPKTVPQNSETPDILLWNTGGWEFGDTSTHWKDYWKPAFKFRFMKVLSRIHWTKPSKRFVWMTTTEIHPSGQLNKWGYSDEELHVEVDWWNHVTTKLSLQEGHEVYDANVFSIGQKNHYGDHIHYGEPIRSTICKDIINRFIY